MTKISHSAAYRCPSASEFCFSPELKRTFSSRRICPCWGTADSQSVTNLTSTSKSSLNRWATGASEKRSSQVPSSGRPKWDISMTAAPDVSACRMVGSVASRRASLVTFPSLIGTLRSSRISTRFPLRSSSCISFMANSRLGFSFCLAHPHVEQYRAVAGHRPIHCRTKLIFLLSGLPQPVFGWHPPHQNSSLR